MSNENFRRELNATFDQMTGSPSASLRDRVRSSIAQAPDARRGRYWIAAAAACVIGVVIVGVLFMSNPLNRRPSTAGPGPQATSTPSTATSPGPSPSPSNLPAFVCTSSPTITNSQAALIDYIDALRTGTHPGYDRLTVEFVNGQPASIDVSPQSGTTFMTSPLGQTVTLQGKNGVLVTIHGTDLHTSYTGSTDLKTGYTGLVEVRQVQDFEGVVQLALGINGPACYRSLLLTNPTRLVIDIQTAG